MGAGQADGAVRLVQGAADPGGAWEYGRLEVLQSGIWTIITSRSFRPFGPSEAQVRLRLLYCSEYLMPHHPDKLITFW